MAARRRKKTSGSVRRLPSGLWQARVHGADGSRTSLGTFPLKQDADRALALAVADQLQGRFVDPRGGRVTLEHYAWSWLEHRATLRPRTRELYESLLKNHILPSLGNRPMSAITPVVVRHWHARLTAAERPGPVTVAKCYRLLRTVLGTAVEDELIVKNPCILKGAGVERSPERPVATIEEVERIASAVDPRYRMLVLMATFTALRFGELAALTRRRIDLELGTVTVVLAQAELKNGTRLIGEPKTAAGRRVVAMPPVLVAELCEHLRVYSEPGEDGLVFVGPKGAPLRRGNWSVHWNKVVARLGFDELHFHDLRHTGNTLAASTGASTRELMTRMGHSSARAALIYQHASQERELAIGRALGQLIESARSSNADRPGSISA